MRLPLEISEEPKTNTVGNVGIVNLEQKKKPHNVTIKITIPASQKLNRIQNIRQSKVIEDTKQEPNLTYLAKFK
jgi:hypothetical protein